MDNYIVRNMEQFEEVIERQLKNNKNLIKVKINMDLSFTSEPEKFLTDEFLKLAGKYKRFAQYQYLFEKSNGSYIIKLS